MAKKQKASLLRQALNRAKSKKRLTIIEMPEENDNAPHWLLWLTLASFVGLVVAITWQLLASDNNLQAFLPFL
jgi:hypothetical protein